MYKDRKTLRTTNSEFDPTSLMIICDECLRPIQEVRKIHFSYQCMITFICHNKKQMAEFPYEIQPNTTGKIFLSDIHILTGDQIQKFRDEFERSMLEASIKFDKEITDSTAKIKICDELLGQSID